MVRECLGISQFGRLWKVFSADKFALHIRSQILATIHDNLWYEKD
jgi:hypothetical protein